MSALSLNFISSSIMPQLKGEDPKTVRLMKSKWRKTSVETDRKKVKELGQIVGTLSLEEESDQRASKLIKNKLSRQLIRYYRLKQLKPDFHNGNHGGVRFLF